MSESMWSKPEWHNCYTICAYIGDLKLEIKETKDKAWKWIASSPDNYGDYSVDEFGIVSTEQEAKRRAVKFARAVITEMMEEVEALEEELV